MITYLASLTIAGEYHYVAKQADSVIGSGTLLPNRELRNHWRPYLILASAVILISCLIFSADILYKLGEVTRYELTVLLTV